jgi:hypothetical protein
MMDEVNVITESTYIHRYPRGRYNSFNIYFKKVNCTKTVSDIPVDSRAGAEATKHLGTSHEPNGGSPVTHDPIAAKFESNQNLSESRIEAN